VEENAKKLKVGDDCAPCTSGFYTTVQTRFCACYERKLIIYEPRIHDKYILRPLLSAVCIRLTYRSTGTTRCTH